MSYCPILKKVDTKKQHMKLHSINQYGPELLKRKDDKNETQILSSDSSMKKSANNLDNQTFLLSSNLITL